MTAATLVLAAILAQVRDAATAASATTSASISGTITTEETPPRPVRRAVVTVNSAEPRNGQTTVTDDAGRYAFGSLPPGRYTLSATKRGWVTMQFGAKAPGRPGRSIPVAAGEKVTVTLALPRAVVISGTITDGSGGPPGNVTLRLLRYTYQANSGERRLSPSGVSYNGLDDHGQYRIYGLAPGEYYVAVVSSAAPFSSGSDLHLTTDVDVQEAMKAVDGGPYAPITDVPQRSVVFSTTYYPGATSPAQATPIVVRAGEERSGVDFTVQYSAAVRVDGVVTGSAGDPAPAGTLVSLALNDPTMPTMGLENFRTSRPGTDGRFEFMQVAPGPYLLIARSSVPPPAGSTGPPQVYAAAMDLDIQSEDQHGLTLSLQDTLTVSGAIRFEGDGAAPQLRGLRVTLAPATPGGAVSVSSGGATVNADGTFTIAGVTPGRFRLSVGLPSPQTPWTVRSATLGGQEALDGGVDVRQSMTDAVITVTNHTSELNGKVDAPNGGDYTLILFAQNRDYWVPPSRRVLTTRTGKDGSFTFRRVPPGDYSLAAVDDVENGEWFDPTFLQRLVPAAIPITIGEGEKKTQNVRVGGG